MEIKITRLDEVRDALLSTLKQLIDSNNQFNDPFQKGYYNGFTDGCNAIINELNDKLKQQ